ncbi:hypothetical protein Nepgr_021582 [Nepenthes gracilis]|uniref:Reverse transcriptase/retrotransposon-derived protein RNase H-like domain-containing protein n=1 Tax=Nepenthes gracilis TaxID=150966 RepID=A0AAD3XXI2_NEPGR|nr:hypothetical protein Nepgr_021582 [Nepenthes gracilis]
MEVQKLTRRVAELSHFLAKSVEKHLPFFKALRGTKNGFQWTIDYEESFQGLKGYLLHPPMLTSTQTSKELYLYLVVSDKALSSSFISQWDDKQRPVLISTKFWLMLRQGILMLKRWPWCLCISLEN